MEEEDVTTHAVITLTWTNEILSALRIAFEAINKLQLLQNAAAQMLAGTHY